MNKKKEQQNLKKKRKEFLQTSRNQYVVKLCVLS